MTVVTICGEPYSSNLGDGVIADCLKNMVKRALPDADVRLLDMSRKTAFEAASGSPSPAAVAQRPRLARKVLPGPVRGALREAEWLAKMSGPLRAHAAAVLPGTDILLIGGGHLLMDNGLRFPMKIRDVASAASDTGVPRVACFGVGVGGTWSSRGRAILGGALRRAGVSDVIARDPESAEAFARNFPAFADRVGYAADPALFCPETYAVTCHDRLAPQKPGGVDRPLIGLGPLNIRQAASNVAHTDSGDLEATIRWWLAVVDALDERGCTCELFTNGDPMDQAVADRVDAANRERGGPALTLADRPMTPAGLVRTIERYDAIVAYRLHANIIAYSMKIPTVPLIWDRKVEHFARLTGRHPFALEGMNATAETIGALVRRCIDEGIDDAAWNRVRDRAQESLDTLLGTLVDA